MKSQRENVSNIINKICNSNDVLVYGSFKTFNFHLDIEKNTSFSDIDCVNINTLTKPKNIIKKKYLENEVFNATGLKINVSLINKRSHSDEIEESVSFLVSCLKTLLDITKSKQNCDQSIEFINYTRAKFFLRTVYRGKYFKNRLQYTGYDKLDNIIEAKLAGAKLREETIDWMGDIFFKKDKLIYDVFRLIEFDVDPKSLINIWEENVFKLRNRKFYEIYFDYQSRIDQVGIL